jgi:hypothetical protein
MRLPLLASMIHLGATIRVISLSVTNSQVFLCHIFHALAVGPWPRRTTGTDGSPARVSVQFGQNAFVVSRSM